MQRSMSSPTRTSNIRSTVPSAITMGLWPAFVRQTRDSERMVCTEFGDIMSKSDLGRMKNGDCQTRIAFKSCGSHGQFDKRR